MSEETFTVADLRSRLYVLDSKIQKARAAVARAEKDLATLLAQREGAEAFLALLSEPEPARSRTTNGGLSALVRDIIAEHPEGISNGSIGAIAMSRGHELDNEQVRSAVTYLCRRGDAEKIGRGLTRLKDAGPTDENGPSDAGPFTLSSLPVASEVRAG